MASRRAPASRSRRERGFDPVGHAVGWREEAARSFERERLAMLSGVCALLPEEGAELAEAWWAERRAAWTAPRGRR